MDAPGLEFLASIHGALTTAMGSHVGAGPAGAGANSSAAAGPFAHTAPLPHGAVPILPMVNDHVMVTCGKQGFHQPRNIL